MTSTPDRIQAVTEFGFTERQARFLVLVMQHAGSAFRVNMHALPASRTGQSATPFSTGSFDAASRTPLTAFTIARGCATSIPKRRTTSSATPGAGTAGRCHHASRSSG